MRRAALAAALLAIATASAAAPGRRLALEVIGPADEIALLREHLRALLAPAGWTLAPDSGADARAAVDLRGPERAVVSLAAGATEIKRTVPLSAPGVVDAVTRAEIGEILLGALDGLPAPSKPAPPLRQPASVTLGLVGSADAWSRAALVPALGLTARVSWPAAGPWTTGLWATARYRWPLEIRPGPVGVRVQGGELDLLLTVERSVARARLIAGVGLAADGRAAAAIAAPGALATAEHPRSLAFAARGAFGFELRLGAQLGLLAALCVAAYPSQRQYVVEAPGGASAPIFAPWSVRPGAALALTWAAHR